MRGIGVSLDMGLATASVTLERFCDELSRQSGYKVVFLAPTLGKRTAPNSHQAAFAKKNPHAKFFANYTIKLDRNFLGDCVSIQT